MRTHASRSKGRLVASFVGLALLAAPSAHAATNEIYDFNLTESTSTYGWYTATTSGGVSYRWLDAPSKWNTIRSASCATNASYGAATYWPGHTGYQWIGSPPSGGCFALRGNTNPGQGNMFYYDGRLSR